ncbi:aminomethyl-transferring glycine dehydrogenase [Lutimaribacter sp. EGI FJ00015]|uniref:Aminomethyl-transferring glycine dehydrogenase n=1 Tax=Lutimaribacter degradans TaxID=2945989 RepID=A0ACC5ZT78_9RHOB|nr:aminomethyl-transferring glycine dehydrogenase [Lutimaribacter sp. EGI FJ00013]MCM2561532.1 aminomethyl-transferring glycine dehydrogenase [Lutimaribacter sp. EGI FJ00013]MCO0612757.1 aminomethyl-transferring glycine dehydrogenase [Lutimaribacter sp. EGI FJ00015]MCO0635415.1 aminomethyl-transferring glycine dehydrogenase [Lutimaribacter sp. EGI FJ00014]
MPFVPTDYLPYDFANRRHIGPSPDEMAEMLTVVGADSLDGLIDETVPKSIRQEKPLDFGKPKSERELLYHMRKVAEQNTVLTSLIGQGYHGTVTPPAIQRNILENPAWYTAYTPYQPEISQGRLEALLNYQTMVADLTGLEIANASLLDEATAAAEAMTMAQRVAKSKEKAFFIDENCHPQNIAVMRTRAEPLGIEVIVGAPEDMQAEQVFGAVFQYPGTYGHVRDFTPQMEALHAAKAVGIVIADPMALCLLKEPGAMGADIAVGSTQRFGVPMGYGGPHAAYMACRDAFKRAMPGRLVGVSVDSLGNRAYRLSLQTREQHIRREKATSNVCTAQALLAVMASMYAVFHGPKGLKAIAQRIHRKTVRLARGLEEAGFEVEPRDGYFDTITVEVGLFQRGVLQAAVKEGVNLRRVGKTKVGITFDEATRPAIIEAVWRAFGIHSKVDDQDHEYRLPDSLVRTSDYLTHGVFHMNRAETEMMRYMRRLADRDLALDRAMIPLGSCTMKLNAAAEMMPISWPEFSNMHPFAPLDQAQGYTTMVRDLSEKLCEITGYHAMSMQPNSGAQGEYAGLLTIAAYHRAQGEGHRNICLIPTSAHGTNPASAQMVGWKVVPVKSAENGDIDLDDFRAKAEQHSENLAGCMITYPSTHGVFEETVKEVCQVTHDHGGQVYIDGANLNAMVGLSRPGDLGGDVSHLNLHKTFAIPHGGGGPGMGPIGVKAHLEPHLPGHPETGGSEGPVSAAPYGSASILAISWAYVLLMGGEGMTQATRVAILNANYIAKRLEGAYDVLYKGPTGRVAHECIIDTRPFADSVGITVDDIAKRLIDCGFHAPTMSWPVAGTLMVEPTESETKAELDRFCDAMLTIRDEIRDIEEGRMDPENNPLKHAPHTMEDLVRDWDRPYSREQGCFPPGAFRVDKYWPPVNRVDNAWGDRHLVCTCPPMSEYAEAAE